jgi:hypothetical protein
MNTVKNLDSITLNLFFPAIGIIFKTIKKIQEIMPQNS